MLTKEEISLINKFKKENPSTYVAWAISDLSAKYAGHLNTDLNRIFKRKSTIHILKQDEEGKLSIIATQDYDDYLKLVYFASKYYAGLKKNNTQLKKSYYSIYALTLNGQEITLGHLPLAKIKVADKKEAAKLRFDLQELENIALKPNKENEYEVNAYYVIPEQLLYAKNSSVEMIKNGFYSEQLKFYRTCQSYNQTLIKHPLGNSSEQEQQKEFA